MNEANQDLPTFPFERTGDLPPPEFSEFRKSGSLTRVKLWDGKVAWLATRYDDVRKLLADNRFSADNRRPGYPQFTAARQKSRGKQELPALVLTDPPVHTRLRRALTKEFAVDKIQSLRPLVERVVDELINKLTKSEKPVDFKLSFGLPLPTTVIMNMLGVPYADHEFFQQRGGYIIDTHADPKDVETASREMRDYFRDLFKAKSLDPQQHDDIMGRLIQDQIAPGKISYDEAAMLVELLMLAGHDSTANMSTLGLLSLMQNPDAYALLRNNPSPEVVHRFVEEMLRYHTIIHFTGARVATEDVQFGDITIKAGEGILPQILAANHDPGKFSAPDTFDLARSMTSPHVAFGFGVHQCLGQPLARLELNVVFSMLPQRLPNIRLAILEKELEYRRGLLVHGVERLPITW
jgi:cytochrome P450